ncbi:unnamed protein product [Linum tenue]|uniref:Amino acid transporter transmembrane domain-containing protein n=2 Tax=Linum tenue TaxID=586396 RepID=A0AAV0PFD2_9ROSI|nr:unnamed protein product [Linum tenue]
MAEVYPINSFSPNTSSPIEDDESLPHVITISPEEGSTEANSANPIEAWLPLTESREGNLWTCVFHLISSGIGVQALLLPVAFASLGWAWGVICLSLGFIWQLYTIWVLVQLHESVPGTRYSRFLQLSMAAFGPKLGKLLALFPVMYLSGASCVVLIINGGKAMELFFNEVRGTSTSALTAVEWFLVFTAMAIVMAQAPNLNSVAGFSLVAAITGISYCTFLWALPVAKGRLPDADYGSSPSSNESGMGRMSDVVNGIGIIMLSFRGHNLILEIQGTLPSGQKIQSRKTMWRAVMISYAIVMIILFPLAIAGFWAYGNKVPSSGGMLKAFSSFHGSSTSNPLKGLIYLLLLLNCLTSYPIYAMPVFDNLELSLISQKKNNKPCSRLVRACSRMFFGGVTFFIAVTFPFLPSLAPLIGAVALPLTLAYPCLMWIAMKMKVKKSAPNTDCKSGGDVAVWGLNLLLGSLGMALCVLLVVGAVWSLADKGLHANFFKPE